MACLCPISIPDKVLSDLGYKGHSLVVPCGHCVGCAHDRVNDWFVRLYSVYKDYERRKLPVWFITVTIDPSLWPNMTKGSSGIRERITPWMRSWNERLRYLNGGVMPLRFLCSEFGSEGVEYRDCHGNVRVTSGALHFHGFLFGHLPIKKIQDGFRLTHGRVDFDRVRTSACIRYAVKYATKDYSIEDPLLRSRTFCSPGIGDPSFYFGDSAPTNTVLIGGFHYRCPRYLVDKQWYAIYGRQNCFLPDGRSCFVVWNAIDRLEDFYLAESRYLQCVSQGPHAVRRFIESIHHNGSQVASLSTVQRLCSLNVVGPGHPLLRRHNNLVSDRKFRSNMLFDESFEFNSFAYLTFVDQFKNFNDYERHQTFLSFPEDFET